MEGIVENKQHAIIKYLRTHHTKHPIYIEEHSPNTNDILFYESLDPSIKLSIDDVEDIEKTQEEHEEKPAYSHDIYKKKYYEPHEWRKSKRGDNNYYWHRFFKKERHDIKYYGRNKSKREMRDYASELFDES